MSRARKRKPIPLVILHPSPAYRQGLASAFDRNEFLIEEADGLTGWMAAQSARVLVVADGSEMTLLSQRSSNTIAVVLLSSLELDHYRRALAGGADGIAHADSQPATIADVVRAAVGGEVILPAEVARQLAGKPRPASIQLTDEELSLLQRLSEGATVVQLADEFYLAERSVRRRLQNLYLRLGVGGRAEALKLVSQLGLID